MVRVRDIRQKSPALLEVILRLSCDHILSPHSKVLPVRISFSSFSIFLHLLLVFSDGESIPSMNLATINRAFLYRLLSIMIRNLSTCVDQNLCQVQTGYSFAFLEGNFAKCLHSSPFFKSSQPPHN